MVDQINLKLEEEKQKASELGRIFYFDEIVKCALAAGKEILDMFERLLGKLTDTEKDVVQRARDLLGSKLSS